MTIAEMIVEIIGIAIVAAIVICPIALHYYTKWADNIKWEKEMLPCPKCGHRAITIHYTGENNPYFFTAECGAYVRRGEPLDYNDPSQFKDLPPMTEEQKKCSFCAGYCADVPHFATRKGAVMWWNRMVEKEEAGK